MSELRLEPLAPGEYRVEVIDGGRRTEHRVKVPADLLESLGLPEEASEQLVRESFAFLLEREAATSILRNFSLSDITRYFPDYTDAVRRRLGR